MAEYIDIDESITVTDTRGRERETTVRHILDLNGGVYTAADVRPVVRGKWLNDFCGKGRFSKRIVQCSLCGNFLDLDGVNAGRGDANYCPNCGADMRAEPPKEGET